MAIDARRLARPPSGIGRYIQGLVHHLRKAAPDLHFLLLSDTPLPADPLRIGFQEIVFGHEFSGYDARHRIRALRWLQYLVPRVLELHSVDLFHSPNFACPLKWRGNTVVTMHDTAYLELRARIDIGYRAYLRFAVRATARVSKAIITPTNAVRASIAAATRTSLSKIHAIHHAPSSDYRPEQDELCLSRTRTALGLPPRFILHVGNVASHKNHRTVIAALKRLAGRGLSIGLVCVGWDSHGAREVRRLPAEYGVPERVHFIGQVEQQWMNGLYNLAEVVVVPSWLEGFGLPVLETMAAGTPVVASSIPAVKEVAGDAAWLAPPDNAEAWTEALSEVLTKPELAQAMRRQGLVRVQQFSWEESAAKHATLYRSVLRAGQPSFAVGSKRTVELTPDSRRPSQSLQS
ncbi:MAG: glycosyltransferase family 4 protein [candidate division WOR-3 bacterium]|nr:MAG: glycosyltransferase family 4 protein [candidate division WOR-3 bacterium]